MRSIRIKALVACLCIAACASTEGAVELGSGERPLGSGVLLYDDVGVPLPDGAFAPVMARGCELPCKGSLQIRTSIDDQDRTRVRLLRRTYEPVYAVERLGDFQIVGIPPGPAGERVVEVTLRARKDRISILALEKETGTPLTVRTVLFVGE